MSTLPIVMSAAGYVPQTPISLNTQLIAAVTAVNTGYTANLPASLIEDVSSTDTYALLICDSAFGDLVNSVTPYGANPFVLNQLGQVYGVPLGEATNTSVFVTFYGPPGFVINQDFVVSDGSYQYTVTDGGVVGTSGQSVALYAVATQSGSWAVPEGTVTQIVTSVPDDIELSVTNLVLGVPAVAAESQTDYRGRVLQAGLVAAQGMPRMIKTLLANVAGVQTRLVAVVQIPGGGWQVVCGGGDPYQVAYAILTSLFDVSSIQPSTMHVTGITQASPGVVSTDINHNYTNGQVVQIAGVSPNSYNGSYTVQVISPTTFSIGVNTSGFAAYVSGGTVSPNLRNVAVSLHDYPDTYSIPYINPPQQTVSVTATWNTTATNYVSPTSIAQLAGPALVSYVNSVYAGQPLNVDLMKGAFRQAVKSIIPPELITRLLIAVSVNGIGVSPVSGSVIIASDPTSYFYTDISQVTVTQG